MRLRQQDEEWRLPTNFLVHLDFSIPTIRINFSQAPEINKIKEAVPSATSYNNSRSSTNNNNNQSTVPLISFRQM